MTRLCILYLWVTLNGEYVCHTWMSGKEGTKDNVRYEAIILTFQTLKSVRKTCVFCFVWICRAHYKYIPIRLFASNYK